MMLLTVRHSHVSSIIRAVRAFSAERGRILGRRQLKRSINRVGMTRGRPSGLAGLWRARCRRRKWRQTAGERDSGTGNRAQTRGELRSGAGVSVFPGESAIPSPGFASNLRMNGTSDTGRVEFSGKKKSSGARGACFAGETPRGWCRAQLSSCAVVTYAARSPGRRDRMTVDGATSSRTAVSRLKDGGYGRLESRAAPIKTQIGRGAFLTANTCGSSS